MFFIERLAHFLAPATCLLCFSEEAALCATCSATALPPAPGCCYVCLTKITNATVCVRCLPEAPFSAAFAACAYEASAEAVVHAFKFSHQRNLASGMAAKIVAALPPLMRDTVVTHIPTAATRKRERGYDQAALLAQAVARQLLLPYIPLLERVGNVRQVGATRAERRTQLAGVFRPLKRYAIEDADILLIDDVLTTGSSLEAAARVLQGAGARSITAAVFAQAL